MRLKSLEMQGFKSFPDKTVVNFDRGITIVVGPNGSGKSNISDAMKWVLGELSSKNIRGSKMEDVIFAGSQKRSAMGFAEVSVTFDNTEEEGKITSMAEYDEITVTRRYYRVGESEYFINRKPVRLRDIHELFFNTGLGKGGYSIIGQGKIAEIISSKSEDRRAIFEEAAGIAKYRHQKEDAQKKLEQTLENLVRLEDIESELEARVGPLGKEAEKAKKYLEIRDEKKAIDLSLSIYDIDGAKEEAEKLEKELASAKNDLDISDEKLADLDRRSEKLFELLSENKADSERVSDDISSLTEAVYADESEKKLAENDVAHLEEQLRLTEKSADDRRAVLGSLARESAEKEKSLAEASAKRDAFITMRDGASGDVKEAGEKIFAAGQRETALAEVCEKARTEEVEAKVAQSVAESQKESNLKKCAEILTEISKHDEDIAMLSERIAKAKEKIAAYDKKLGESSVVTEETSRRKAEKELIARKLASQKNDLFLEISQRKHQVTNLLRMEELLEGYSRAVRFVMSEYKQGSITDARGNVPTIYGPVSQFVTVPEKYAAALEVAFGQSLQNIIVADEDCAKTAINFLKKKGAGRATFYPMTTMKGNPVDAASLGIENIKGYISVASGLVSCEEKFRGIIDYLTGRIIVAENMDDASVIARKLSFKYKVVTLDGQVINAGGSYTGGSVSNDSQMLSRRATIDRLGEEIRSLERESEQTEKDIAENEAEISKIRDEEKAALGSYSMIKTLADAESTQMQILGSNRDVIAEARASLQKQYDELFGLSKRDGEDAEDCIRRMGECREKLAAAEKEMCDVKNARSAAEKALDAARQRLSDCSVDLAREEKNVEMCRIDLDSCNRMIASANEEIASAEALCAEVKAKIAENTEKISACEKRISDTHARISEITSRKSALSSAGLDIERKLTETRTAQKEISHTRDLLFRQFTGIDAAYKRATEKQDKLISFLWEEYEITYSEACAAGYEKITEKTRHDAVARQSKLKSALKSLGDVHVGAIEEYKEVKERYETLSSQTKDLRDSKEELFGIVASLEERMKEDFSETFEQINKNFGQTFAELFGGGHAELKLSDSIDVLNSGIDINVAPPGKIIKNMSLLSGGEQAFVAIALYFAILKVTPSPFCILDEIEAALDEVNVDKFAQYLKSYCEKTQFVVITHRRGTMEAADRIYGVTMHEKGISDVLSIDISEIESRTGTKPV